MFSHIWQHISEIAVIFSAASLALVASVFALFIRPKLKELEQLSLSHGSLATQVNTLKIPENLSALQALQAKFSELDGRDLVARMAAVEASVQKALTAITILEQSEAQRNERLTTAIDDVLQKVRKLEEEIGKKIARGDGDNLGRLLAWRVDQLEIGYTLSKIRGGTQEEDARDKWIRAKDELAEFLKGGAQSM